MTTRGVHVPRQSTSSQHAHPTRGTVCSGSGAAVAAFGNASDRKAAATSSRTPGTAISSSLASKSSSFSPSCGNRTHGSSNASTSSRDDGDLVADGATVHRPAAVRGQLAERSCRSALLCVRMPAAALPPVHMCASVCVMSSHVLLCLHVPCPCIAACPVRTAVRPLSACAKCPCAAWCVAIYPVRTAVRPLCGGGHGLTWPQTRVRSRARWTRQTQRGWSGRAAPPTPVITTHTHAHTHAHTQVNTHTPTHTHPHTHTHAQMDKHR